MVVPAAEWYAPKPPRKPMGQWLVDNMPRGVHLDVSDTHKFQQGCRIGV